MTMVLTAAEVEAIRFHLGYGNIAVGAYPHTPDGYFEAFTNVVAEYLSTGAETTATTAIAAGSTTTVTPVSMTGIAVNVRLIVDVADEADIVVVKSVTATTFTAKFALAHPASGYPIAVESGVSRARYLIHRANKALEKLTGGSITTSAGLKSVGRGAVVWQEGGAVFSQTQQHYRGIVEQLSSLVRVLPRWANDGDGGRVTQLEAY